MKSVIEQFLQGEIVQRNRTAVSDSRELLMDKLDDILDTDIFMLAQGDTDELVNALLPLSEKFARAVLDHDDSIEPFEPVTIKAVQIMSLVIAAYAQALEKEEKREQALAVLEDEEVSDST